MTACEVHFGLSFDRSYKSVKKRYRRIKQDIEGAIDLLCEDPFVGDVIPQSSGLRKLRVLNSDLSRGKSGGYRVIYSFEEHPRLAIYLLLVYCKTDKNNVTIAELRDLVSELSAMSEE